MTDRPNPYQRGTASWLVVEHRRVTVEVEERDRQIFTLKALLREAREQIQYENRRCPEWAAEGLVMRIDSTLEFLAGSSGEELSRDGSGPATRKGGGSFAAPDEPVVIEHERNGPPHNECVGSCEACRQSRIADNASTQVAPIPELWFCARCAASNPAGASGCGGCGLRFRHG